MLRIVGSGKMKLYKGLNDKEHGLSRAFRARYSKLFRRLTVYTHKFHYFWLETH